MEIPAELRKTAADTGYAVVGATDIAVERVRRASARAAEVRAELEVKKVQDRVQHAPTAAVTKGLEAAGRVEETYADLSARGKKLVERIRNQRATHDLVSQSKVAVSRTKGAVTTVRRGASDTESAAKATVTTARREGAEVGSDVRTTARKGTSGTRASAKRTTTTAKRRTANARSATKAATTSTSKAADAAVKATEAAAQKVGD